MRNLLAFLLFLGLVGCSQNPKEAAQKQKNKRLPASKGLPSELLLVVDKAVWDSDVADTLMRVTEEPVAGLTQSEPFFRVSRIFSSFYTQRFTTMHSQLFVHLDEQQATPLLGVSYDVVAKPQIQVTVRAHDLSQLRSFLSQNRILIQDLLCDAQLNMRVSSLRKKYSRKVFDEAKEKFGVSFLAPEEIRMTKRGDSFLWGGTGKEEKDLNVVLYSYPWDGSEVSDAYAFADKRDSVMQTNIPGGEPDQWMQTTRERGTPVLFSRQRKIGNRQVFEVRGLWEMHHAAMGGPFVSHVCVDTASQRVLVAEGFAYSPSTEKRDLIRLLEASLRTLDIPKKK